MSSKISILAEYRFLKIDYENKEMGERRFGLNTKMLGPFVGLGIRF